MGAMCISRAHILCNWMRMFRIMCRIKCGAYLPLQGSRSGEEDIEDNSSKA